MSETVIRSFNNFNVQDDQSIIEGVPIVFEQPTDIGGLFEETIARDALTDKELRDVAFFLNHDLNKLPLARTRNKKLKLDIKPDGVHMVAEVNRERNDVNDLFLAIQDGLIDGMSFMFRITGQQWTDLDTDYPKRRVTKIGYVQEVSAVTYPAYQGTSIDARTNTALDSAKKALDSARAATLDSAEEEELALAKAKALIL